MTIVCHGSDAATANLAPVKFSLAQVANAVGGTVTDEHAAVMVDGATQDSREIGAGQLFVPLVAERDGHDFISMAIDAGASGYLTHRPPEAGAAVQVANTTSAMRSLAQAARARIDGPVIAITGSVGKTSTNCLLYTSPSPRDRTRSRMPSSA